jgi:DNA-binding GntR family transcriptional regulator
MSNNLSVRAGSIAVKAPFVGHDGFVHAPEIDRSSTAERVADALRLLMFDGDMAAGSALREVSLARSFRVSRTTVREALALLAVEGLVTRSPNRGAVVTLLSAADLEEIFLARRVLETAGIRAAGQASPEARALLRAALAAYAAAASSADHQRATAAHLEFHNALVGLLDNARLTATAGTLTSDLRLALARVGRELDDAPAQVAEHRRLLELVEAADIERASAELEDHLTRAKESVQGRFKAASGSDAGHPGPPTWS